MKLHWHQFKLLTVLLVSIFAVAGCTGGGSDEPGSGGGDIQNSTSSLSLSKRSFSALTSEAGLASFTFSVPSGSAAMRFEVFTAEGGLQLVSLRGPKGNVGLSGYGDPFVDPRFARAAVNVLALPVTNESLESGAYTATYLLTTPENEGAAAFAQLTAQLSTKQDSNLAAGVTRVNIILVGAIGGSEEFETDLGDALSLSRTTLLRAGIRLDARTYRLSGPTTCPNPADGDVFYESLANQVRADAINIALCYDLEGFDPPDQEYTVRARGLVPVAVSKKSVSVLSIRQTAGSDGRFNFDGDGADQVVEDELRLAGEEIAQLIGHALGLSHIVDLDGDQVLSSDNLTDTMSCVALADCREESSIRENFMFPYPLEVPDSGAEDFERTRVSAGQAEVMQRSIFVD
ncbi:MAG: hypothetical protein K1X79_06300 [Oligoflexia bacterium]|nr:hypothetical protein [Oligoflexia bacterium]